MREYTERAKNLRIGRQDSLRSLGGYGEDGEEKELINKMKGAYLRRVAEFSWEQGGNDFVPFGRICLGTRRQCNWWTSMAF